MSVENKHGCPCLYAKPCHENCTCVKGHSSVGCARCCRYGSLEQRQERAEALVEIHAKARAFDAYLDRNAPTLSGLGLLKKSPQAERTRRRPLTTPEEASRLFREYAKKYT